MEKISKTRIERRLKNKTNPFLVKTIIQLKKTNPEVAKMLASPSKKQPRINLGKIDRTLKEKESALVVGKVLGSGELTKKIRIVGFSASVKALESIKKSGSEFVELSEEIKKNPKLNDLVIVR
jgi:large subunit ribosomal protein L18e